MASMVPFGRADDRVRVESGRRLAGRRDAVDRAAPGRGRPHVDRRRLLPLARDPGASRPRVHGDRSRGSANPGGWRSSTSLPRGGSSRRARARSVGSCRSAGAMAGRRLRSARSSVSSPGCARACPTAGRRRTSTFRSRRGSGRRCTTTCGWRRASPGTARWPARSAANWPRSTRGSRCCRSRRSRRSRRRSPFLWLFRAGARVFTAFGLAGLVLTLVGIWGVNAYMVLRRTREIGIRTALGASPRGVIWLIVRDTTLVTAAGVVAGTALARGRRDAARVDALRGDGFRPAWRWWRRRRCSRRAR